MNFAFLLIARGIIRLMAMNRNSEEKVFRELIETVRDLRPGATFLLSKEELRLICRRQVEFWMAVEGRLPDAITPKDSKKVE